MDRTAFFARKPVTSTVELADGSVLTIKKLAQGDVARIQRDYQTEAKKIEGYQFIAARAVVDESGARIFTDADLAKLADVDFDDLNRIALAVLKFSGMAGVEDDEKNEGTGNG